MGRGNVCVKGKYEGLYFIDYDLVERDFDLFFRTFTKRFKSFSAPINTRFIREGKIVLENSLFEIVFEDNEWSLAVKLLQKDCDFNAEPLQKKHFQKYFDGLRDCLFEYFDELGIYTGPWTHGIIKNPKLEEEEKQRLIEEGQKEQAKKSFYED